MQCNAIIVNQHSLSGGIDGIKKVNAREKTQLADAASKHIPEPRTHPDWGRGMQNHTEKDNTSLFPLALIQGDDERGFVLFLFLLLVFLSPLMSLFLSFR